MPSPGRVQLNLSVEPEIKNSLKKHCEAAGLSFAQAITEYVKACDLHGELIISPIPSSSTGIDTSKFVTQEQLNELTKQVINPNPIPGTSIDIDEKIDAAISALVSNEKLIKAIAVEVQKIANATTDNVQYPSENALEDEETEEDNVRRGTADEEENTTQIDKASLAPIFNVRLLTADEEEEEEAAEKSPLTTSATDSELAKKLGLNKSTIYRYRTGKPKQSQSYQQVMEDWQPIGDRWYPRGE